MIKLLLRIFIFFLCTCSLSLAAADKLVLQLAFEHDFRAAGFYAAKWQGYYDQVGLDVDIRSVYRLSGERIDPVQALRDREADLAFSEASEIVIAASSDQSVALITPIYSRSSAILVCNDPGCTSSSSSLRVGATSAYLNLLLDSELIQQQFSQQDLMVVQEPLNNDAIRHGLVDVLLTSSLTFKQRTKAERERFYITELLEPVNGFPGPAVSGLSVFVEHNPGQTADFIAASIKGWRYALENPEEVAQAIAENLPRHQRGLQEPLKFNLAIADEIANYLPDSSDIGIYHAPAWLRMQRQLSEMGEIPLGVDPVVHMPGEQRDQFGYLRWTAAALLGFILSVVVALKSRLALVKRYLTWLAVITFAAVMQWQLEAFLQDKAEQEQRSRVFQRLSVIRADIEGILINSLSLLQGLAAHIGSKPDLSAAEFERFSAQIFERGTYNNNYAAAPDMVVRYVYPYEGNQKAIGLNYLTHPTQRRDAVLARDKRAMVVTDPVELVQGGNAIIARAPVYYRDDDTGETVFWGIVSSPIDIHSVFHDSGLLSREELQIAVRSQTSSGKVSTQVVGDATIFSRQPVLVDLPIADKHWQIAAIPTGGGWYQSELIWPVRLMSLLGLLSILATIYALQRRSDEKQRFLRSLQFRERLLQDVGRIAKIGAWELDCSTGNRFWSHALYRIFQIPESPHAPSQEVEYKMFAPDVRQLLSRAMEKAKTEGDPFDLELPLLCASSENRWVRYIGNPVLIEGNVATVRGAIQDITQRKQAEQTILKQANYDALTNLPNRNLFDEQLSHHIAYCERSHERFVLLFFDLDQFKSINDSLGHHVGDELLIAVAERLGLSVRKSDFFSRRSGDEFTLLITQIDSYIAAEQVAKGILDKFANPFIIQGKEIYTSASIGLTIYPDDGESASQLLKNADQAMYAAKEKGRNRFSYFTDEMQRSSDQRLQLQTELIGAISRDEIEVFYQPIVELDSGTICKCEALVRWNHPERGYIPPVQFIPIAEEFGLIAKIGRFVMDRACNDIAALNQQLGTQINIAINKSVREFEHSTDSETDWVDALFGKAIFPNVTIEITESLLMGGDTGILQRLERLKQHGATIAIDDFGTGYSSLSYLKRFPIDLIKIDRSFVQDIDCDGESRVLVEAILAMAESLGIEVVAEGVETQAQQQIIVNSHCRFGQGYLYSKPLPIQELRKLLESQVATNN